MWVEFTAVFELERLQFFFFFFTVLLDYVVAKLWFM